MKFGTGRPLDAMVRPEGLQPVAEIYLLERHAAWVLAGEGLMLRWVPILRQHDQIIIPREPIDRANHAITIGHCQRAALTEIPLNVRYQQNAASVIHNYCPKPKTSTIE
jgi:hypothetical protein